MAYELFGDEWAKAYGEMIRASDAYNKAAATWEWPMVFRVVKDPSVGLHEDRAVYLDLWHGDCREARPAKAADFDSAPYVVSGDVFTWKQVFDQKLDPLGGIMRGRLKLDKGQMAALAGYVLAAKHLVGAATKVDTVFPEGVS